MADLSANAPLRVLGQAHTDMWPLDTSAAQTIYKGQGVMLDATTDTTHVVGYVDAIAVTAADLAVGIAAESVTVASGDPETKEITVFTGPTIVGFKSTVFTVDDVGEKVWMSESGTLSKTKTANLQIGKCYQVRDGYVFVLLDTPRLSDDVT